jgi:hypothetical protein
VLLGVDVQSVLAHRNPKETVSQGAAPSHAPISVLASHLAARAQPLHKPAPSNQTFHLLLEPFSTLSATTAAAPPPGTVSLVYTRYTIFPEARDPEEFPFLTAAGVLAEPTLDIADAADVSLSVATLGALSLLAAVNYRFSDAFQLRLSRFSTPADFTPLAPFSLALTRPQVLSRLLTVAQVHGSLGLGASGNGVLRYALYAGVFAEETPRDLIAGAHIGYTVGTTGFTLGIGYLYGPHAVGLDIFGRLDAAGTADWPGGGVRVFGMHLLADKDKLRIENQLLYGVVYGIATSEQKPLAVQAKPTLHINRHWTVFYRFDHLRLGQGLPKLTEHAVGVKFHPVAHVHLHAEFMVERVDDPAVDAGGFRLSGTIRF